MNANPQSPWRIPAFWLVVGLPLLSIVAGVGLVVIAVRAGGADVVSDRVQRVSQIQTSDLGADEAAASLKLSALVRVLDGSIEVVPVNGKFPLDAPLQLVLEHPTQQDDDLHLQLQPQGRGWRTLQAVDASHDWEIQLRDAEGHWRLKGRLPRQQRAAHLAPSLGNAP